MGTVHMNAIVLLWAVVLFAPAPVQAANSLRCIELGVNCIADEPLNTNSIPNVLSNSWFNPADTTGSDKQASSSGVIAGGAIETFGGLPFTSVSAGEDINALPAGHTITWMQRTPEGGGSGAVSHKMPGGTPTAIMAFRFYRYYSLAHGWTGDGAGGNCNSGKLFQGGTNGAFSGFYFDMFRTDTSMQTIGTSYGWNLSHDGSRPTPGFAAAQALGFPGTVRGKLWRVEILIHNNAPGGVPTWFELYAKNVTDNTQELRVIDSRVSCVGCGNWVTPYTDGLHVTATQTEFTDNLFRSNNGDACPGFISTTHHLWAAWNTDAGQRIGAAVEVEGSGGGDTTPPVTPRNPRIAESPYFHVNLKY